MLEPLVVDAAAEEAEPRPEADKEHGDKAADAELKRIRAERDLIAARNGLRSEQAKAALAELSEEKERLSLENALFRERVSAELLEFKAQVDRVSAQVEVVTHQMSLASAQARQELQAELAALRRKDERLSLENAVIEKETGAELSRLRLAETQLKVRRSELEMQVAELQATLAVQENQEAVEDLVTVGGDARFRMEPLEDGTLYISDRRIALNGPIWSELANYVTERINFYNNQSAEYPIFLVIDASPGGSVMSGYRILKAMEGSKAPVYVVVKSYAASMAAIIAAMAERSYAYPNAVLLHHELSWYGVVGNLTQQKEYAEEATEWWRRLAEPVARKMGVTIAEYRAMMYQKNSLGDWAEFADEAQRFGWVDTVIDRIWETSVSKNPDRFGNAFYAVEPLKEMANEKGERFMLLPRLEPFDFYYLHDRGNYFRLAQ